MRFDSSDPVTEVVVVHYHRAALAGFGVQGQMLLRPLLEAALTADWARHHRNAVARRYGLHRKYALRLWAERRRQSGIYQDEGEPEALTVEEFREARRMFGRYAERNWTGVTLREMADDVGRRLSDPGTRVQWQGWMETGHPFVNWTLHATGVGSWQLMEQEDDLTYIVSGPSDACILDVLSVAWWMYIAALNVFCEELRLEWIDDIRPLMFAAWSSFKDPNMMERLRPTDLCPCKSGMPYQACHGRLAQELNE